MISRGILQVWGIVLIGAQILEFLYTFLIPTGNNAAINITGAKTFKELKIVTSASDGNLGAQLNKLEELEYLVRKKEFINKKPQSTCTITENGMSQFKEYDLFLFPTAHSGNRLPNLLFLCR